MGSTGMGYISNVSVVRDALRKFPSISEERINIHATGGDPVPSVHP